MQNLSVREFEKLYDSLSAKQIIFSSENQVWDTVEKTIKVSMTFTIMLTSLNPNVICFKNSTNYLCLNRVKSIKTRRKESPLGAVFDIVCGDSGDNTNDVAYTIIVR